MSINISLCVWGKNFFGFRYTLWERTKNLEHHTTGTAPEAQKPAKVNVTTFHPSLAVMKPAHTGPNIVADAMAQLNRAKA